MSEPVAKLQDELIGALVGLARACAANLRTPEAEALAVEVLAALPCAGPKQLRALLARVRAEKARVAPNCAKCASPCGNTADYDMERMRRGDPEARAAKSMLLWALSGLAARIRAGHCAGPGLRDFLFAGLSVIANDLEADVILAYAVRTLTPALRDE